MSTHGCLFPTPSPGNSIPCGPQQLEQLPWLIPPSWLSPPGALMGCWVDPSRVPGSLFPPRPGCSWLELKILAASEDISPTAVTVDWILLTLWHLQVCHGWEEERQRFWHPDVL